MEYSTLPKLTQELIQIASNIDVTQIFGKWTQHTTDLQPEFSSAAPFPHIIIPDFLVEGLADQIERDFPVDIADTGLWHEYMNPIEVKYANDQLDKYPASIRKLFLAYANPQFIDLMRQLTGIPDLEYDEFMHGAGLHIHPSGGRLGIHLDYERHPITGKQRRINIILYMTSEWDPTWNGHTELWSADMAKCIVRSPPVFNHALIFQTNDISWHGLPEPIRCPHGQFRKSIAYYYVSPFPPGDDNCKDKAKKEPRLKASFVPRPGDPVHEGLAELYQIRPHRRITKDDVARHYPEWSVNLG